MSDDAIAPDLEAKASPTKIAFLMEGSRGDTQPYIQLAVGLKDAGHHVRYFSNCDLADFVMSFGVEAVGCGHNAEEAMRDPALMEAMKAGDFFKFVAALNSESNCQRFAEHVVAYWEALEMFQPELVMFGPLTYALASCYEFNKNVPIFPLMLQPNLLTAHWAPFGLPSMPVWTGLNKSIWKTVIADFWKSVDKKRSIAEERLSIDFGWASDKEWFLRRVLHPDEFSDTPGIIGTSVNFSTRAPDWPKTVKIVGWWTMTKAQQEERSMKGDSRFNAGGAKGHQILVEFLAAGPPPVYIGWGSMICKSAQHMTTIAVQALRDAEQRGIILGGWAQLSLDCLSGAKDEEALRAYCAENVLFMDSAPHAWLFPQCACIVHHGGSGTTAASVLSGAPSIITPVFLDQWDYAKLVNEKNIGVGTAGLVKLTSAKLGRAIRKCISDESVKASAKRMAELVGEEDGIQTSVRVIEGFIGEQLQTGKWAAAWELRKAEFGPKPNARMCCPRCRRRRVTPMCSKHKNR